ncbi:26S proteasome non-ATPase regulatory subunit 10-like [Artemia franciscana]|uniref:26S proteasome non-ATPase regulatory subunit 10-like n=1 Tax=Artemia franciscana TaxID=6661 RepID=UPI0032DA24F9
MSYLREVHPVGLYYAVLIGSPQTVERILKSGTDVNITNNYGETQLHFAASRGYTKIVECLIKYGADVNMRNCCYTTPLHFAASRGYTDSVECLLKYGADVNARNDLDQTPLHLAALKGSSQIVKCLLKYGAYVNSKDKTVSTALHFAIHFAYHTASLPEDKEIVAILLEHGSDINITNINGDTAFDLAEKRRSEATVELASHALKLKVANLYVSNRNISLSEKAIPSYRANELKDQFETELEQMKSETIFCNISFYDIFIKGISSIELYTMNENSLKSLLKSAIWEEKFSMYNAIIKSRFRERI